MLALVTTAMSTDYFVIIKKNAHRHTQMRRNSGEEGYNKKRHLINQ